MSTKLWLITLRAREDPTCTFTSLAHVLTADFLKECFWELKRGKAPGIDGVTWGAYEANVDENITDLVARLTEGKAVPTTTSQTRLYTEAKWGQKTAWDSGHRGQDCPTGDKENPGGTT